MACPAAARYMSGRMEWEAPGIVLSARPFGEADAVISLLTTDHGVHHGLARGAQSRSRAAIWQAGNLVQARWVGRLADQLGSLAAELVHQPAAFVLDDPLALAMLSAACATAEGALPEREAHPRVFDGLLNLLAHLPQAAELLPQQIRWEAVLLADLGYGLDLASCAVTGTAEGLAFVSPKSGRAVSEDAAGTWKSRLLPLPRLLLTNRPNSPATLADCRDGLRITGHFLARDAFGLHHKPLPPARQALYDRVAQLAERDSNA